MEKRLISVRFYYESIKIISFEEEQSTYKIVFTTDGGCSHWDVAHKFSHFKLLNLLIQNQAPRLITSEFPKDNAQTGFLGKKPSEKAAENRRRMLEVWTREVLSNYEAFPAEVTENLRNFVNAPKVTRVQICLSNPKGSNSALATCTVNGLYESQKSSGAGSNGSNLSRKPFDSTELDDVKTKGGKHKSGAVQKVEAFILLIIRSGKALLQRICMKASGNLCYSAVGSQTVCVTRRNKVITKFDNCFTMGLVECLVDELYLLFRRVAMAYLSGEILTYFLWRYVRYILSAAVERTFQLWVTSLVLFCSVLYECSDVEQSCKIRFTPSYVIVEDSLRSFLRIAGKVL
jgi:hypothetical protein